jgi:VIT1/CCC1 family predicted Fe2+/Mn2+ transporter
MIEGMSIGRTLLLLGFMFYFLGVMFSLVVALTIDGRITFRNFIIIFIVSLFSWFGLAAIIKGDNKKHPFL